MNQIGTLTETLDAIEMAKRAGCTAVCSPPLRRDRGHDSSPTWWSPPTPGRSRPARRARTDRVAKYNQLLRIEEMLGEIAEYPGLKAFYNLRR